MKKHFNTKILVACGLLTGISIVLTRMFSYVIPLGGLPALRIGFGSIPITISGILFGPIAGALTGGVADLLGFMINPMGGPYIPGMTITAMLGGFLPGIIYWGIRKYNIKINFNIINIIFITLLAIGTFYILLFKNGSLPLFFVIIYGIVALIFIMLPILLSNIISREDSLYSFDKILFVITVKYFINSLLLNTFWLSITYNKGFLVFLPGRIIAGLVMIPLRSFIIFALTKVFKYIKIS
ncbi:folate family ECF transporter S component [Defluviitalea phaphyphila]|uniref:folate family ECF transporter S component n=1 Tax=Defluviitalea phaphyphila TaxID=1473580 RepID=UPI00073042A3|nr:folate family ECF transporter S component [Defluviitalea phaphyphila]